MSDSFAQYDKCLVVDDNRFDRLISKVVVQSISPEIEVIEFTSGLLVAEYIAQQKDCDILLLLDLNMPEMTGFEVLSEIQQNVEDTIQERLDTVIVTSSLRTDDQERCVRTGMIKDFLIKPISVERLKKISV